MCLVSMWHFVFLVTLRRKPTPGVLLGTVIQLAILILAWRIRGATIWVFGFVILLALVSARHHLRLPQFKPLDFRWSQFANSSVVAARSTIPFAEDAVRWPIVLLLVGLLGSSLYDRASLHPVYFTDDVMLNRGLWNDAYRGLAIYDPSVIGPRVVVAASVRGIGELGWWMARDYMDEIRLISWDGNLDLSQPAPGLISEWTGIGIRTALQDRLARGAFMSAVRAHPVPVLKIYLVRKPRHTISTLIKAFTQSMDWVWLSVLVGAGTAAFVMRFSRQDEGRAPRDMILLSGGAVLASTVPSLWAYPSLSTMGDSVLLLAAFTPITVAMSTAMVLNRRRADSGKMSEVNAFALRGKEGLMRAVMAPFYRIVEHANGYALAQLLARPTTDRFRALIRKQVNPSLSEALLDVGCGTGNYRSSFACQYSGVDINPDYIKMASSHLDGRFMVMDCTRLEFEDATFDHVVSLATLHHLTDEQVIQMVREAVRVCKSSGRVHLIDAILPVTPNFAFKRIVFQLDRGGYPRTYDHLCELIAKAGHINSREIMAGPLHDVTYVGVTPSASRTTQA
jgi:SAM-dependent methyltransferase